MAEEQSLEFVFDPLPPGEIRLLHIESWSELEVQCKLEHVDLSSTGDYYALSYVWGTAAADRQISLNGASFRVTENLRTALKAIQNFHRTLKVSPWVWIDAVCINQQDVREKERQIPLMDQIYSRATSVLIWFSAMPKDVQMVVEALKWMDAKRSYETLTETQESTSQVSREAKPLQEESNDIEYWSDALEMCTHNLERQYSISPNQMVAFNEMVNAFWIIHAEDPWYHRIKERKALFNSSPFVKDMFDREDGFWPLFFIFMSNDWFHRVWTYQEIHLCQKAYFVSEDAFLGWDIIDRCLECFVRNPASEYWFDSGVFQKMRQYGHDTALLVASIRRYTVPVQPRRRGYFMQAFGQTRSLRARNPKDHIYGLVGLLHETTRAAIRIDYSRSDVEVFADAAKVAIKDESKPSMLPRLWDLYKLTEPAIHGLPSWCPDFSAGITKGLYRPPGSISSAVSRKCDTRAAVDCTDALESISFSGLKLDDVTRCTDKTQHNDEAVFFDYSPLNAKERRKAFFSRAYYSERREWLHSLQTTFPRSIEHHETDLSTKLKMFLLSFGSDLKNDIEELAHFCDALHFSPGEDHLERQSTAGLDEEAAETLRSSLAWLTFEGSGRYFFETASGKMGISPRPLCAGDIIVYVPGGPSLNVLSADGSRYVSTAWVEGYMGDSLLNLQSEFEDRWQTFCVS